MGNLCSNPEPIAQLSPISSFPNRSLSKTIVKRQINPKSIYRNLKMLGKGSYSSVYLVENKKTGSKRAIKEIRKSALKKNAEEIIYNEMIILSQLDHPNIAKIFEIIDTPSFFYIISEYLEGGELFQRLTEVDHIDENLACKYMFDIVAAINYCHSKGIAHKDLKPENLMFDILGRNAALKIIDFGTSAKLTDTLIFTNHIGVPRTMRVYYASPEQFIGHVNEKSDIWSLGVIMYMMLCNFYIAGKPPFYAKTFEETADKILNQDVEFKGEVWNNVSNSAQNLIEKLLRKDPESRPSANCILTDSWFNSFTHIKIPKSQSSLQALKNFSGFQSESKIAKLLFRYISCQHKDIADNSELTRLFKALDKNTDGKLSPQEILDGLGELGFNINIQEIMKNVDIDKNGFVDYSEFLVATQNWKKLLAHREIYEILKSETSENTFNVEDFKSTLPMLDNNEITEFFSEIDTDRDGKITMEELKKHFLSTLVQTNISY
ncbi:hypothetical protein SteCoe_9363 [Stentor coeruleus]|uniref:non-specific serine/threonine protein kinase n=1 Tax=Stentor coeruleus TaxID=5963 RepID=A0A1R2CHZ5_9CILI|nr:hypothetical protein SteCoe_9363 [Stentor coeruleus]